MASFLERLTSQGFTDRLAGGNRVGAISLLLGEQVDPTPPDWRVRLSLAPTADYLYQSVDENGKPDNNIMAILRETNGVVWPYTPNVTMQYSAGYDTKQPTHSNYPVHTYQSSRVSTIGISGDFTAQTEQEARYLLASMMFLRSATKMFWANDGDKAGQPPPVLYLNGYGSYFLPNVPVVITDYTANLPDDVDYVEALVDNGDRKDSDNQRLEDALTRIPSSVTMSVSCEPVYSRRKLAQEFSFEKFSKGQLIGNSNPGSHRGGFV